MKEDHDDLKSIRHVPKRIIADPVTGQGDARRVPRPFDLEGDVHVADETGVHCFPRDNNPFNDPLDGPFGDEPLGCPYPDMDSQPTYPETPPVADGGGKRYSKGKNRMELVPPEWEWALADVTTQGSKKYEVRNWERGMDWSEMVGCMKRHLAKFQMGERYDGSEFNKAAGTTGCHHLAMVAWNALALMSYDLRGIGNNNLPVLSPDILELVNAVNNIQSKEEENAPKLS